MSTQNVNVARFARNVEWDFFCDFQTPCTGCPDKFWMNNFWKINKLAKLPFWASSCKRKKSFDLHQNADPDQLNFIVNFFRQNERSCALLNLKVIKLSRTFSSPTKSLYIKVKCLQLWWILYARFLLLDQVEHHLPNGKKLRFSSKWLMMSWIWIWIKIAKSLWKYFHKNS